ncbi:MAG TPA: hypothetical protein DCF63_05750 [Planctomycetaceae bacterium]|nr:hypothetical protein [Planctomycetaceae bacterium]
MLILLLRFQVTLVSACSAYFSYATFNYHLLHHLPIHIPDWREASKIVAILRQASKWQAACQKLT